MAHPKELLIGLTNLCTTSCLFCYRRDLHLKPRYFPIEKFKSLLDELGSGLECLEFSGIGEPLMHPQFKEFVVYTRHKYGPSKLKLQLASNGSLLTDDLIDFLIEQRFGSVWISLNAATAETYSHVMPGLNFEVLIQRICRLRYKRDEASLKQPSIMLTFVVTRANSNEVEDFLDLGIRIGAEKIAIRSVDHLLNEKIYNQQVVPREQFEPILEKIEARAKMDVRIECAPRWAFWPDDFPQPNKKGAKSIYCPNALNVFGVYFSSGEVTPCCYMAAYIEKQGNCISNIYEESALEIWEKAKSFAELLNDVKTAPDICRQCTNFWGKQWISSDKIRHRLLRLLPLKRF